jgi:hypothetical protein
MLHIIINFKNLPIITNKNYLSIELINLYKLSEIYKNKTINFTFIENKKSYDRRSPW